MRRALVQVGPRHEAHTPRARGRRFSARAGISLLEVVFSVGVVMIGLVGIAALLPIAGVQANKGAVADAAARRGRDAVREFHVRGMANYNTWRWYDPAGGTFRPLTDIELLSGNSFCIDPRFVSRGTNAATHTRRNGFPFIADMYPVGTLLEMPRLTLAPTLAVAPTLFMGQLQADEVFTGSDDLVFDLPPDRTLGPLQNFSLSSTLAPLKRNTNGTISWMATLVPKLNRLGVPTDEYTLSIVVFSRRIIDQILDDENKANERVVAVRQFFAGQPAIGGGDVELTTRRNFADDLELRSGNWVLLSSVKNVLGGSTPTVQVHKWYRVANAGEEAVFDSATGNWVRDVTLVGPDWDWGNMGGNYPGPGGYVTPTQVTIVRGVVAVFEKTIRLESSSLWMN